MSLITWSEDLSVNIPSIDAQHKKLVELVNRLHDATIAHEGDQSKKKILDELIDYTKTHFANEEKLMSTHQYPAFSTHKKEHDRLTRQVMFIYRNFTAGQPVLTVTFMNFLKDWIADHIKGSDKKYGPYLANKGV